MAKWQRVVCLLASLAGCAVMIANGVLMILRNNDIMSHNERLHAVREQRKQVEMPVIAESSQIKSAWAHSDIDREEMRLLSERWYTSEGYAIKQSLVTLVAAMCLFAVGLTLRVTWRRRSPPAAGSNTPTTG